jgi:hypothetical protein
MKIIAKNISGIKVKASIKAGGFQNCVSNHNTRARALPVKSAIKAGEVILMCNHNRVLR